MINSHNKEKKKNKKCKSKWKSSKKSKNNSHKDKPSFPINSSLKITPWYCKNCFMSTSKY